MATIDAVAVTSRTRHGDLGLSRVYSPTTMPDEPINDLAADIAAKRSKKKGA